jgi:predicted amidohydrolase YtcJ
MQYSHAVSDRELVQRIWADRVDHAYPFAGLLASGARIAAGSDAPVEELDPVAGLRAAAEEGVPAGAALESFTVAPAWLSFDEERRGRLRAGFDADLAILDRDPLSEPATEVLGTMVAGEWVGPGRW